MKLDGDSSPSHAGDIASWGHALDTDADLLIYGCDLASTIEGQDLVAMLALVCNCDVAASDDATGSSDFGGDWVLEYTVGDVDTHVAFGYAAQASWRGVLNDVTTDLELLYAFDTTDGDLTGYDRDGMFVGDASIENHTVIAGSVGGGALDLDGSGDALSLDAHASDFNGLTEGALAMWVKTSSTGTQTLFDLRDADGGFVSFSMSLGQLVFVVNDGTNDLVQATSTATVNNNAWHHVAVKVGSSGNRMFIDGVELIGAAVTYATGNATTTAFLNDAGTIDQAGVGAYDTLGSVQAAFNGAIDDVRIYSRDLATSDISDLHALRNPSYTSTTINLGADNDRIREVTYAGISHLRTDISGIHSYDNNEGRYWV